MVRLQAPQPPLAIALTGPVHFDLRLAIDRRMGIGDHLVKLAAMQHVSRVVPVSYTCDDSTAGLYGMGGLTSLHECPAGAALICWRHHVCGSAINSPANEFDPFARHPVERALWGFGWQHLAGPAPALTLYLGSYPHQDCIAWSPVEVSRAGRAVPASAWASVLERWPDLPVVAGCSPSTAGRLSEIVAALPEPVARRVERRMGSLTEWTRTVAGAAHVLTANTGTLWLALGVGADTTVVQRDSQEPHGRMWDARTEWGVNVMTFKASESPPPPPA